MADLQNENLNMLLSNSNNSIFLDKVLVDILGLYKDKKQKKYENIKYFSGYSFDKKLFNIDDLLCVKKLPQIKYFLEYLTTFPSLYSNSFYKNISNLKIEYLDRNVKNHLCVVLSSYDVSNNTILISDKTTNSSVFHELFHIASTKYDLGDVYSGFSQINESVSIGYGLTEGYTELLNQRYFGKSNTSHLSYSFEKNAASCIEKTINKDKMEYLYFDSDLLGLIENLSHYNTRGNVMKFLADLDFVNKYINCSNLNVLEEKLILKSMRSITDFLIVTYVSKLIYSLKKDLVDIDSFEMNLRNYLDSMLVSINFMNKSYEIIKKEEIENYFYTAIDIVNSSLVADGKSKNAKILKR